ncbi:MAG: hypothetical protein LQ351_002600 [Letrouitia transgressa]|nr:MAG: hypothetical protein LQ351_002600 [Letrouitia transgressa]
MARKLRYQALGKACRSSLIEGLITAHHSDDQAETVLLRLFQGRIGESLHGIQAEANIDCRGDYGLVESGGRDMAGLKKNETQRLRDIGSKENAMALEAASVENQDPSIVRQDGFEYGGIKIYRPFLSFSKEQLKETCRHHNVDWVEDATNHDPTKTPRNAIRHLLRTNALPAALQPRSVCALAERVRSRLREREARAEKYFERCTIDSFHAGSGRLVVQIPPQGIGLGKRPSDPVTVDDAASEQHAARFLLALIQVVTPFSQVSVQKVEAVCAGVFPELKHPNSGHGQASYFTVGNVHFHRLDPSKKRNSSLPDARSTTPVTKEASDKYTWVLERQNFSKPPPADIRIPRLEPPNSAHPTSPTTTLSPWQLWDGRYWFRVFRSRDRDFVIRPLTAGILKALRDSLQGRRRKLRELQDLLDSAAPGNVRFTLPVLMEDRPEATQALALPTLGFRTWPKGARSDVQWMVRYKQVRLPGLKEGDFKRMIKRGVVTSVDQGWGSPSAQVVAKRLQPRKRNPSMKPKPRSLENRDILTPQLEVARRRGAPQIRNLGNRIL